MTPNYEYIQNLIKNTLANKPAGHEITPEEHQNIELALLEYAKDLELLQVGTLIGFADANTVPVQPNGTNAAYLNTMPNSTTITFHNFRDINGKQISVTTDNEYAALNILFWNAGNKNQRNGWSIYTTPIHISAVADLSYIVTRLDTVEDTSNEANQRSKDNTKRLDIVEGTANEANQRSKDNLTRLDRVEGTANATKALVDAHTTRLDNLAGVANEANQRSKDNLKRLDKVEGVANGAQALANSHTELISNVEATANEAYAIAKNKADNVENIYVYELDLTKIIIPATIDNKLWYLTYVSGQDVTVNSLTYGKFAVSSSRACYIMLTGAILHKNDSDVYTYDGTNMTSVGGYVKADVKPYYTWPTFAPGENDTNTMFHLYDGSSDRYYYWDPDAREYIQYGSHHIRANKFYIWKSPFTAGQVLVVTFDDVDNDTIYNEYMIQFSTGATLPTLSFPAGVKWNLAPDLDINVTYQVSVVNNIGLIAGGLE